VHHLVLFAPIPKACRHPVDQTDRPIRVSQQQRSGIGAHRPAIERRHHAASSEAFELELLGAYTLFASDPALESGKCLIHKHYPRFSGPMHLLRKISGLGFIEPLGAGELRPQRWIVELPVAVRPSCRCARR